MVQGPDGEADSDERVPVVEGEVIPDEGWADLADAPFDVEEEFVCRPSGEDDEVVQDDQGQGHQLPREMPGPKAPSSDVIKRHNLTHWPYAPWCPWCLMARRNAEPHFQCKDDKGRLLPLLVMDYCFMKNADDDELLKEN